MKKILCFLAAFVLLLSAGMIGASATMTTAKIANPTLPLIDRNPDPESDDTVLFAVMRFDVTQAGKVTVVTSRKLCSVYILNNGKDAGVTKSKDGKTFTFNAKVGTISVSLTDWPKGFTLPTVKVNNYEFYKGYITSKLNSAKMTAQTKKGNVYTSTVSIKANTKGELWFSSNVTIKTVSSVSVNAKSYHREVSANTTYTLTIVTEGKPGWFKANGITF